VFDLAGVAVLAVQAPTLALDREQSQPPEQDADQQREEGSFGAVLAVVSARLGGAVVGVAVSPRNDSNGVSVGLAVGDGSPAGKWEIEADMETGGPDWARRFRKVDWPLVRPGVRLAADGPALELGGGQAGPA
jgi:hypothetical protein